MNSLVPGVGDIGSLFPRPGELGGASASLSPPCSHRAGSKIVLEPSPLHHIHKSRMPQMRPDSRSWGRCSCPPKGFRVGGSTAWARSNSPMKLLQPNISSHTSHTWHSCWNPSHRSPQACRPLPYPTLHCPCQLPFMRAFYLSKPPFRKTKSALLPIHWPKGSPRSGGKGLHRSFLRLPLCTVHPSPTRCILPLGSLPYLSLSL